MNDAPETTTADLRAAMDELDHDGQATVLRIAQEGYDRLGRGALLISRRDADNLGIRYGDRWDVIRELVEEFADDHVLQRAWDAMETIESDQSIAVVYIGEPEPEVTVLMLHPEA